MISQMRFGSKAELRRLTFPRWETPWCRVLWGERKYTIRSEDRDGTPLALTHDCVNGIRSGNGL